MCLKVSAALHSSHYPGVMTAVYLRPALSSSVVTARPGAAAGIARVIIHCTPMYSRYRI